MSAAPEMCLNRQLLQLASLIPTIRGFAGSQFRAMLSLFALFKLPQIIRAESSISCPLIPI